MKKSVFERQTLYIYIRSPCGEPAMVLRYLIGQEFNYIKLECIYWGLSLMAFIWYYSPKKLHHSKLEKEHFLV
jgi:hypothetical protein